MRRSVVIASLWILCLTGLAACTTTDSRKPRAGNKSYFYKPSGTGSDSLFNPLNNNVSYALDSLQLTNNFSTDDFNDNLNNVWYNLQHPRSTIKNDGGTARFINREIFPIYSDRLQESAALLPNYALHMMGGGMTYRKDLEWFRSRGHPFPMLASVALAMTSELIQEAIESADVINSDALADFYIFRPLGLWLFSSDRFASYIQRTLQPAVWPSLQSLDLKQHKFINTGISYVYRPPILDFGKRRGFIYTGFTNLFGLSHQLTSGDTFSWGVGVAVKEITSQRDAQADLKTSVGIFYDRNNSLIWSAVLNDAGNARLRVNIYPRGKLILEQIAYFFSISDNHDVSVGLVYRLPLGAGVSKR